MIGNVTLVMFCLIWHERNVKLVKQTNCDVKWMLRDGYLNGYWNYSWLVTCQEPTVMEQWLLYALLDPARYYS